MVEKMDANSEQGNFISANGIDIYYQEFGTGEPLVFLHGGMGTSQICRPVTEVLAKHFRVISPDSRGHGRTENPLSDLSYQLMADDIAAFISAKNIDSPFVCGWSDGGQIAIELGIRYPGLAKALVIILVLKLRARSILIRFKKSDRNHVKSGKWDIPHRALNIGRTCYLRYLNYGLHQLSTKMKISIASQIPL